MQSSAVCTGALNSGSFEVLVGIITLEDVMEELLQVGHA
jgi:hypothetical protein